MPSNHLILCHSFFLLPSIFPSISVFSNELTLLIRRPTYWSFSLSISPSNEYSALISFSPYKPTNLLNHACPCTKTLFRDQNLECQLFWAHWHNKSEFSNSPSGVLGFSSTGFCKGHSKALSLGGPHRALLRFMDTQRHSS